MAMNKEELIDVIANMTVMELSDLVHAIEDKFGVSAAAPMAVAAVAAGPAAAEEEKTEFDVILAEIGSEKIKVIKAVRELTGLGLKEAKAVVDEAPSPLKQGIEKAEAEEIKKKFEEVGAKIEIK